MPRFVLGYLDWEERLRTGQEADANSRTSKNAVKRKFAGFAFYALRWKAARLAQPAKKFPNFRGTAHPPNE